MQMINTLVKTQSVINIMQFLRQRIGCMTRLAVLGLG